MMAATPLLASLQSNHTPRWRHTGPVSRSKRVGLAGGRDGCRGLMVDFDAMGRLTAVDLVLDELDSMVLTSGSAGCGGEVRQGHLRSIFWRYKSGNAGDAQHDCGSVRQGTEHAEGSLLLTREAFRPVVAVLKELATVPLRALSHWHTRSMLRQGTTRWSSWRGFWRRLEPRSRGAWDHLHVQGTLSCWT